MQEIESTITHMINIRIRVFFVSPEFILPLRDGSCSSYTSININIRIRNELGG
jgi:hypothetical protein